jgi:hypothetical protein
MGHLVDRCDFIDVLEESAVTKRAVQVELERGERFVDNVRDVVTEHGADFAVFKDHGRIPVAEISDCARAEPFPHSYDQKL